MRTSNSRRIAGVLFCAISAFMYSIPYIAASIMYTAPSSSGGDIGFEECLKYFSNVDQMFNAVALAALLIGFFYIVLAETRLLEKRSSTDGKTSRIEDVPDCSNSKTQNMDIESHHEETD